jgi:hypothetical protein
MATEKGNIPKEIIKKAVIKKVINTSCGARVFSINFARSQDKRADI